MATNPEESVTMSAVQGKDYGDIDEMISVEDGIPVPKLSDIPPKKRDKFVIVRTLAVALAPGDCRTLSGKTKELQGPPSFPYIPGGDCCGVVVEMSEDTARRVPFKVGDTVAARFVEGPRDALAEYAKVHIAMCDRVPEGLSFDGAAAVASSGTPAVLIADRIKEGERVLIIGARGGVGSHLCQLVRLRGASYVAGVSCDPEGLLKKPLNCDKAVDYTKEDPWSVQEWIDNPFDVIVDLAGGGWLRILEGAKSNKKTAGLIIKTASQGGRYLTTTPDEPIFEIHSIWGVLKLFLFTSLWRATYSRSLRRWRHPKFTFAMSLPEDRSVMTRTLDLVRDRKLEPCVDPDGPFPFTTEGVRRAFRLQESRHVRGKVVIRVAEK